MIDDALEALRQIFSPPFRRVLWKVLGLSLLLLVLCGVGADRLILHYVTVGNVWLATALSVLTGLGLFVGFLFLIAPVSSLVAGFYLDELAEHAEREIRPGEPGRALPMGEALRVSILFALVSLLVNVLALLLLLVPGVNLVAFLAANAYLQGRQYFELAALRYRPMQEVRELRRRHAAWLFFCGLPIALFLSVPLLNLLTPLFATAFMVRVHARLAESKLPK